MIRVTFDYYPDEPDDTDPTGMSEAEYDQLTDALSALGADHVTVAKVPR